LIIIGGYITPYRIPPPILREEKGKPPDAGAAVAAGDSKKVQCQGNRDEYIEKLISI